MQWQTNINYCNDCNIFIQYMYIYKTENCGIKKLIGQNMLSYTHEHYSTFEISMTQNCEKLILFMPPPQEEKSGLSLNF